MRWLVEFPEGWAGGLAGSAYVTENAQIAANALESGLIVRELVPVDAAVPGSVAWEVVAAQQARMELLERQRDDATAAVAHLACLLSRVDAVRVDEALALAEAAIERLCRELADEALRADRHWSSLRAAQDDLEQREAALGRALRLARALYEEGGEDLAGTADRIVDGHGVGSGWPDVVRWVADSEEGPGGLLTEHDAHGRMLDALADLYNWDRDTDQQFKGLSHLVRQAAYQAVTRRGLWQYLKEHRGQRGGESDGERQGDAAQGQASAGAQGPEPPDGPGEPHRLPRLERAIDRWRSARRGDPGFIDGP